MWDDITKSIKASLHDRTSSPLAGAFIVSWCVINYEVLVLLLLGNDKPVERIENIKHLAYMNWADGSLHLFGLPLATALFWIFLYPYPAKLAFKFSKARSEELIALKNEIEKKTLLTQEQSDEIRIQMENAKHEYVRSLESKDATIEALNRKISELQAVSATGKQAMDQPSPHADENIKGKDGENGGDQSLTTNTLGVQATGHILSNEAKVLLKTASKDRDGTILNLTESGGRYIQVGDIPFGLQNARDYAKWKHAFDELLERNLIVDRGHSGEVFELTHEGWKLVDTLPEDL